MPDKVIDKIEKEKRIRAVMEWIIEDWPSTDIIANITAKWELSERQAKRYIAEARERWNLEEDKQIDRKRRTKIESLKKLKRSLKDGYRGTPLGIRAILQVEREIIKLQGLEPARKVELTGKNGQPIKTESSLVLDDIDYSQLSNEVLLAILNARTTKHERNDNTED